MCEGRCCDGNSDPRPFSRTLTGVLCTRCSKSIQPRGTMVRGLSGNVDMEVWVWRRRWEENEPVGLGWVGEEVGVL